MYSLRIRAIIFIVVLGLAACEGNKVKTTSKLYPIDSLIKAQAGMLAHEGASLEKLAEIDGVSERSIKAPGDTTSWMHELDVFAALDAINMPTHVGEYEVVDGKTDRSSNLTVLSFKTKKDLPVVYLNVFYHESPNKIRRIEALCHESNALFSGTRHLAMEFQDIYDRPTLMNYTIEGGQDMFLSKDVKFSVRGTITIP